MNVNNAKHNILSWRIVNPTEYPSLHIKKDEVVIPPGTGKAGPLCGYGKCCYNKLRYYSEPKCYM